MKRPTVSVRDPETRRRILREMNDEEFAQWEIVQAQAIIDEERRKAEEKDRKDKAKKLSKELATIVDLTEGEIAEVLGLSYD